MEEDVNLCDVCKTNCRDRETFREIDAKVLKCRFFTDQEHDYTAGVCKRCGKARLVNEIVNGEPVEYDSCLGYLPGVKSACCGHGGIGHILFNNDTMIRFNLISAEKDYEKKRSLGFKNGR